MKPKNFKYAGVAAVALEYAASIYFLYASGNSPSLTSTVSDFGAYGATSLVFSIVFSLAGLLFGLFGLWLTHVLPLHRNFKTALYIGVVAQLGLSWFPVEGNVRWLHYIFATIIMIVMPVLVYYFSKAQQKPGIRLLARGIVMVEVAAIIILAFSVVWHISLVAEALTFIGFQLWVVLATFEHRS
jgi:hypothetical protein